LGCVKSPSSFLPARNEVSHNPKEPSTCHRQALLIAPGFRLGEKGIIYYLSPRGAVFSEALDRSFLLYGIKLPGNTIRIFESDIIFLKSFIQFDSGIFL
jgi:hypothetical protein